MLPIYVETIITFKKTIYAGYFEVFPEEKNDKINVETTLQNRGYKKKYFQHFFEHALVKGKSSLKTPIERFTLTDSSLKSDSEHVSAPSETR